MARNTFDKLLGPSIKANFDAPLPAYYFEDITSLQLTSIMKKLLSLGGLIDQRRSYAEELHNALQNYTKGESAISCPPINRGDLPTYWQFVVRVGNTRIAQHLLFEDGVETGITNLPDLAELCGIELGNAKQLKAEFIFLPLHCHLRSSDYMRLLTSLNRLSKRNS
jgi:dTDP-4-amino-4,6-dideoxygalactose transaminase